MSRFALVPGGRRHYGRSAPPRVYTPEKAVPLLRQLPLQTALIEAAAMREVDVAWWSRITASLADMMEGDSDPAWVLPFGMAIRDADRIAAETVDPEARKARDTLRAMLWASAVEAGLARVEATHDHTDDGDDDAAEGT